MSTSEPMITLTNRQETVELHCYQPQRACALRAFCLDIKSNSSVVFIVPGLLRSHTPIDEPCIYRCVFLVSNLTAI